MQPDEIGHDAGMTLLVWSRLVRLRFNVLFEALPRIRLMLPGPAGGITVCSLLAGLGLTSVSSACAEVYLARATAVPDGDTLWVQPEMGGAPRKLRLQGIDAPEICQSGGLPARDALRALVAQKLLRIDVRRQDDYARGLARVQVDGQDVGATLVRTGQAWSYRWQRSLGPYASEEAAARNAKLGVFAESAPELPRDFRQRNGSCYVSDAAGKFRCLLCREQPP